MNRTISGQSPESLLLAGDGTFVSTYDLLTILIGTDASAILGYFPTLSQLENASPQELSSINDMGDNNVVRLLVHRELARRRATERGLKGTPVISAEAAVDILEPLLRDETREVVIVLALDTKKRLICSPITVAIGTISSVRCHPREIFRPLIRMSASSAIIAHLHPSSGEPVPSPDDVLLTTRLKDAGEMLDIPIEDHIVIGKGTYISMNLRGLM